MDRKVANEKKARDGPIIEWPKTPGELPKMSNIQWSDMKKSTESDKNASKAGDKVDELLKWRVEIDHSISEINWKLDLLLAETRKSRDLENQETPMGTKLGNACSRLDSHHDTIQGIGQSLAATTSQVHHLTNEIRLLKDEKEVTVTFKSGRQ
ncbi:hypothetical protein CkaCkLH20_10187 [Colletotrichum karsti]|uniref:Uncharacterized protein n=1 Tax=Colletotrichum karsti TaxID=1095194 RepID=A0A9P6HY89_9PEZI|nr:uncharacterized protein CkaCkLH20_10187 [Colletotrichum karsti]KAF9872360.1 hypothetical protein CkaCkLH20_10187 [Colletotrichum karsti]